MDGDRDRGRGVVLDSGRIPAIRFSAVYIAAGQRQAENKEDVL